MGPLTRDGVPDRERRGEREREREREYPDIEREHETAEVN